MSDFDAIVVGSGISGGWAAKELTERGLKTLVLERGPPIDPAKDYTDMLSPWEMKHLNMLPEVEHELAGKTRPGYALVDSNKHFWANHADHPYEVAPGKSYAWFRGHHVGGRSLMWGRQSYRLSDDDLEANKRDGHGVDWPIRYRDLEPWYAHVERFAGISGTAENIPTLPDSVFQPGFELNCAEKFVKAGLEKAFPTRKLIIGRTAHLTAPTDEQAELGRGPCQARNHCARGCSFGAYFSSNSATLPAAERTGNLTLVPNAVVHSVVYDPKTRRASGVRVVDAVTRETRTYTAKVVFLCASTIPTAGILLNSTSEAFPNGLANGSGQLGRNLMDHVSAGSVSAAVPGYLDTYYRGRRPTGFYIPRYGNATEKDKPYLRGFGYQGGASRAGVDPWRPGVGEALKTANRTPGPWRISMLMFGEVLPYEHNRVTLHPTKRDKWGMPVPVLDAEHGENERVMMAEAIKDAVEMFTAAGCTDVQAPRTVELTPPGDRIHEMGTARMGRDPKTSVLNGFNQAHEVSNLFVTDGSCMTSSGTQNPSLTYMALTARAADHAASRLREGAL